MNTTHQPTELWSPPEGFVLVPTLVDGIEIYAPAPEEKPEEETRTFKCRHCGGTISYSATEQQLACPYCGGSQKVTAEEVGRTAAEFEFTLETMERARYGWGEERRELVCEACGAAVAVGPDVLTSSCAFCGSNRVHARDVTGELLRPTALVPFVVDQDRLRGLVVEWLGRGWMHPPELRSVRALQELTGIYLPFWTFDADIHADWKAEVGTERTESYRQDGEWKTRTVIDWHWRSGRVRVPIDDHLVAGTRHVSRVILGKVEPFDLSGLTEYESSYLAGWQAKGYDVQLQDGWKIAKEEMRARAKSACYRNTGSSHVRNFRMTADFADERWRYILLPVYLASYPFDGHTFQVMVNGQTGNVAGQKPVAWARVWLAIAAMLSPGACLGLLGLLTLPLGGVGIVGVVIGGILLVAALIGAFIIFQKARASEEA
jgi:Zn finger protein HypA/HybF involved in hydrogenase expression